MILDYCGGAEPDVSLVEQRNWNEGLFDFAIVMVMHPGNIVPRLD